MSPHQKQLIERLTSFIGDAQELRGRLVALRDQLRQRRADSASPRTHDPDEDLKAFDAYADSTYSYSDASALASLWGLDVHNAKLRIGWKVLGGQSKLLQEMLYEARIHEHKLSEDLSDGDAKLFELYADSAYSYDDAAALATLWSTGVYDAKLLIGTKIQFGDQKLLQEMLYEARIHERKLGEDLSDGDAKLFGLYADSRYSYNDADTLATFWGIDVYSAKLRIGTKIQFSDQKLLDGLLYDARAHDRKLGDSDDAKLFGLYVDSTYSYNDAETLATFWGIDVHSAKLRIGTKIQFGDHKLLQGMLYDARVYERKIGEDLSDGDAKLFELYADSRYGYTDAEALAGLWSTDVHSAKLLIGTKVQFGDHKLLDGLLHEARLRESKVSSGSKYFELYADSRYGYDDAATLASFWSVDVMEAKEQIGWKVRYGHTKILDNTLAEARLASKLDTTDESGKLFALYVDSPFSYDDAEALAALWSTSIAEAKSHIGRKMRSGDAALIRASLDRIASGAVPARSPEDSDDKALDLYVQSGFSYADTTALSSFWEVGLHDAKLRIGWKLAAGQSKLLQSMLYDARVYERKLSEDLSDGDAKLLDLYADSPYTYDDARSLAALWGVSVSDAKLQIGWKISTGSTATLGGKL